MDLFFRKSGDGPPLIILHGLYGSSDNWMTVAGILSSRFSVLVPDLRNHGRSPHDPKHNYEVMSGDLKSFASKHAGDKYIMLGHSMGGKLAVTSAIRNPESVAALIVADISPFSPLNLADTITGFHRRVLNALNDNEIIASGNRTLIEKRLSDITGDTRVASFLMKNLKRLSDGRFMWQLNTRALLDNIAEIMGPAPVNQNSSITGFPVLFIRGGDSEYLPESHYPYVKEVFPAADFVTLPGTGHWLHAEKPQEFTDIVLNFLT